MKSVNLKRNNAECEEMQDEWAHRSQEKEKEVNHLNGARG